MGHADVDDELRRALGRVISSMFQAGELERWWLDESGPSGAGPPAEKGTWLHLCTADELWDVMLRWEQPGYPPESDQRTLERVAEELQDRIAESGFAWGQLRWPDPALGLALPGAGDLGGD